MPSILKRSKHRDEPFLDNDHHTKQGLLPNTVTANIRSVFQHFGEVTRIFIQLDGRCARVVLRTCPALSACIYRETFSRPGPGDHHVSEVQEYEPRDGGNGLISLSRLRERNCWRHGTAWKVRASRDTYVSRFSLK